MPIRQKPASLTAPGPDRRLRGQPPIVDSVGDAVATPEVDPDPVGPSSQGALARHEDGFGGSDLPHAAAQDRAGMGIDVGPRQVDRPTAPTLLVSMREKASKPSSRGEALFRLLHVVLEEKPCLVRSTAHAPDEAVNDLGIAMLDVYQATVERSKREVEAEGATFGGFATPPAWMEGALLAAVAAPFMDASGLLDEPAWLARFPEGGPAFIAMLAKGSAPSGDPFAVQPGAEHSLLEAFSQLKNVDPALAVCALDGMAQIPTELPALEFLKADPFTQSRGDRPFQDHILFGVQHMLATQVPLFDAMQELGFEPDDMYLLGVPYSTNDLVVQALRTRGYHVSAGQGKLVAASPPEDFHTERIKQIEGALQPAVEAARRTGKKILVLDDGGLVSHVVKRRYPGMQNCFTFVEQTTRGITEASRIDLEGSIVDVARSEGKTREADFIANCVVRATLKELADVGVAPPRASGVARQLTLVGYGRVGSRTAERFAAMGFDVTVVDSDVERRRAAVAAGFSVAASALEAAPTTEILLGASGHRSVDQDVLAALPEGAIVGSASSAEAEIEVGWLRQHGDRIRGVRAGQTQEYTVGGKNLILLRDGRPVNFDNQLENVGADYIQLTRALMLTGALQAVTQTGTGIAPLDVPVQERLLGFLERYWRGCEPVELMPKVGLHPPLPAPLTSTNGPARFQASEAWNAYLRERPEVFPRTEAARAALGYVIFRDEDGVLQGQDLHYGLSEPPVRLPEVEGELLKAEVVGPGRLALTLRRSDGEKVVAHLEGVQLDPLARERSSQATPPRTQTAGTPHEIQGRVTRLYPQAEQVGVLGSNLATSIRQRPEGLTLTWETGGRELEIYDAADERLAGDRIPIDQAMDHAQLSALGGPGTRLLRWSEEPPSLESRPLTLGMKGPTPAAAKIGSPEKIDLPEAWQRLDDVVAAPPRFGEQSSSCLLKGQDKRGQPLLAVVDTVTGAFRPVQGLPPGARVKSVRAEGATLQVRYLPEGQIDEEPYYVHRRLDLADVDATTRSVPGSTASAGAPLELAPLETRTSAFVDLVDVVAATGPLRCVGPLQVSDKRGLDGDNKIVTVTVNARSQSGQGLSKLLLHLDQGQVDLLVEQLAKAETQSPSAAAVSPSKSPRDAATGGQFSPFPRANEFLSGLDVEELNLRPAPGVATVLQLTVRTEANSRAKVFGEGTAFLDLPLDDAQRADLHAELRARVRRPNP